MISFKMNFKCLKLNQNQDFQNSIHIFTIRIGFLELNQVLKIKLRFLKLMRFLKLNRDFQSSMEIFEIKSRFLK